MAKDTYKDCRCPKCKLALDEVEVYTEACPRCDTVLEPERVWATRKYAGQIDLPPWITAFTWPLILIGLGLMVMWWGSIFVGGIAASFGIVYFFAKILLNDRDV